MSYERIKKLDNIGFIWDSLADAWEEGYQKISRFHQIAGHCRVPQKYKLDDFNLGSWVSDQRSRKNALSNEQFSKLEDLGFTWDVKSEKWNEQYEKLQNFFELNGHTQIRVSTGKLGVWIVLQRQRFAKGHISEREKLLLEQFPDWSWDLAMDSWKAKHQDIQQLLAANSDLSVRNLNSQSLQKWLTKQRAKKTKLTNEQQKSLESLRGFSWDPHDHTWNSSFDKLKRYLKHNGSYPTLSYVSDDGFRLGSWLNRARAQKHLSSERKQLLQSLPGWSFNKRDQDWQAAFDKYADYVSNTGSAKIPAKYLVDEAFDLGRWVTQMKKTFDNLDPEKKSLLESLAGWSTDYREDKWNHGYSKLVTFTSSEGHACPPQSFKTMDGFRLGLWVSKQRNDRVLNDDRIKKLEQLQGWSWNPDQDRWDHAFVLLKKYEVEYGHCSPKDKTLYHGFGLAGWIYAQKKRYVKGSLQEDRIIRLNSLRSWKW